MSGIRLRWSFLLEAAMARSNTKPKQGMAPNPALWVYNPWLDMIVGCGAWSAPLVLLSYLSLAASALQWAIAFYVLAFVINYPHYTATMQRALHCSDQSDKFRRFALYLTLLAAGMLVVAHSWTRALPWIFTLYLTWSPWHYSGQNYGVFMRFARRAGVEPTKRESQAMHLAFLISCAILLLNFHTGPSADPLFISLNITAAVSAKLQLVLGIAFAMCSAYGLSRMLDQAPWRKMLPALTLFSTQLVWFFLPTMLSRLQGLRVLPSYYGTGMLAAMHAAQYLWIASDRARREATEEGRTNWRPIAYFVALVLGGIALFVPGPWIASRVFHADYTRSLLIFTAVVNLHHFFLDAVLRAPGEGRVASLLSRSPERILDATGEAGSRIAVGVRWLVGPSPMARAVRIGSTVALLAGGTVDQVRYYLALHDDNLRDLRRAAALNSYDAPLEMRLARKELDSGKPEAALSAWKWALQANPADPAPRDAMLQYLTERKRYDEAYELTRSGLQRSPRDAQLLVNHGLLAMQMGNPDEALKSWRKAIATDPSQIDAHLYLAAELDREGSTSDAVKEYEIYMELLARQAEMIRPPAAKVIGVALKLAECQVRANQPDQALRSYDLARKIATQAGEGKLESFASIGEAALRAKTGKIDDALRLYQHALQLDASLGDPHNEALDWYNYAIFLHDAGFPVRLSYASLLKSEALMEFLPDAPDAKSIAKALQEFDKNLGAEAVAIRRHPEPVQQQALALTRLPNKLQIDF
jgi:tetratricopeptide (TPR) repeat protein